MTAALILLLALATPPARAEIAPGSSAAAPESSAAAPENMVPAPRDSATVIEPVIGHISVVGNHSVDSTRIVRSFEIPTGMRYSLDAVRRGIRKLVALDLFDDAWVERLERPGIVDLVIHVVERPRISKITFSGNRKRQTADLEKKLFLRAGEVYSLTTVQTQIDSLIKYYDDEGYSRATIDPNTTLDSLKNQVVLDFAVHEGEKVKITRIEFAGVSAFPTKKLLKAMKTKRKGFFGGGEVKDANFKEDQEKLEAYYHDRGYREMRLVGHELKSGDTPEHLTMVMTVDEGRPYSIGTVSWSGNVVVPLATLQKFVTLRAGDRYNASKIEKAQQSAYAEYAERGYLYLNVEPREMVRDSVVDVTLSVTEGQPSKVRLVNIVGNKATREKVLRREIEIHEGDRFQRSKLVRTQGDLSRLGLFEDVQLDFAPAESTDVDINLKVKEKQVGTASAGAGYTGTAGLTGFLDLGHNNVLGNGQSLALHLERGGKLTNYQLSFTEPWFHDTPTLLGASIFDNSQDLVDYKEKRVGASGRIGRPLPWPSYSRGSISYQLEEVTISALNDALLNAEQRVALLGVKPGVAVLTSTFSTEFLRNSTNEAFYPTRGSRLSVNDDFAGGPFGGSVNYHKHRIEARWYLPSFKKGVTTMVRGRIGLIGRYTGQASDVPPYERFRLGGGSTADPLRGYDDFQVVPGKYIRDVVTPTSTIDHIDSLTTPGVKDTVYKNLTQRVRYPGGRFLELFSFEQQFPIVAPLHGVLFFDAGNTWDLFHEIQPLKLKLGAGFGMRIEIPLLGNIGFDYAYGFNRDDGARWKGHFLLGNVSF